MYKIAVVGDLSLMNPDRLEKAMHAAWASGPDLLVHVGDIHPGYTVFKRYVNLNHGRVLGVPGNHDVDDWDLQLGLPHQWSKQVVHNGNKLTLIGLDNSRDSFVQADWDQLKNLPDDGSPCFIFVHKPLSKIVLEDGSESNHIMGEGSNSLSVDAGKLKGVLSTRRNVLLVHGHYHGWTLMGTNYADCLIEGRGGAGPEIGYSVIYVTPDGWAIHRFDVG